MAGRVLIAAVVVALLAVLAGCGGGSDATNEVTDTQVGTAAGTVVPDAGSPTDFRLMLDGQEVGVSVSADGKFQVPGIPPGDHVIDVVGPDGMEGERAAFRIEGDETVELPPIRPRPAGQITGLVLQLENDGTWIPAEGVSVIARSDLIWIMKDDQLRLEDPDGNTVASASDTDANDASPLIYPPPEGVRYDAVTDDQGSYVMKGVRPGGYFVTVSAPGWIAREVYVNVMAGRTAAADFRLKPDVEPEYGIVAGQVVGPPFTGVPPVDATQNSATVPIAGAIVEIILEEPWMAPPSEGVDVSEDVTLPGSDGGDPADPTLGVTDPAILAPIVRWDRLVTRTDENGMYKLRCPVGERVVRAWAWGYMAGRQKVTVKADETVRANFDLEALVLPPEPEPEPRPDPDPLLDRPAAD